MVLFTKEIPQTLLNKLDFIPPPMAELICFEDTDPFIFQGISILIWAGSNVGIHTRMITISSNDRATSEKFERKFLSYLMEIAVEERREISLKTLHAYYYRICFDKKKFNEYLKFTNEKVVGNINFQTISDEAQIDILIMQGRAFESKKDVENACLKYEACLELIEGKDLRCEIYYSLSRMYVPLGKFEKAFKFAKKACELTGDKKAQKQFKVTQELACRRSNTEQVAAEPAFEIYTPKKEISKRIGTCANCQKSEEANFSKLKMKLCARCKSVRYCGVKCQRAHWKIHKKECVDIVKLQKNV